MSPFRVAVPTRHPPAVTWALIAASCAVFFFQLNLSPAELQESGMDRRTIVLQWQRERAIDSGRASGIFPRDVCPGDRRPEHCKFVANP